MIGRLPTLRGALRSRLALGTAGALALLVALAPAEHAPPWIRAGAAAGALAAAAAFARGRLKQSADPRRLVVVSRQALSREAGIALVEVDGRAVLIGWGGGPVRLLRLVPPRASRERNAPRSPEVSP